MLKNPIIWDDRRHLIIPGNKTQTIQFAANHFADIAASSIKDHGAFYVALSGGSTPKALFEQLITQTYLTNEQWAHIHLFWSDERAVSPLDPDSNYKMAIDILSQKPILPQQIHRMHAEQAIETNALKYEQLIQHTLKGQPFDLIMLGMGDDGHTASLFPYTAGLTSKKHLIIANYIPQKKVWRMTMTFDCIHQAHHIAIYVLGEQKKQMVSEVFLKPDQFERLPIQQVGIPTHPALWIMDDVASSDLLLSISSKT